MKTSASGSKADPDGTERIKIGEVKRGLTGNESFVELTIQGKSVLTRIDDWNNASAERLNRYGAHLISRQARLIFEKRLQEINTDLPPFPVATQLGLHGRCFVLPGRIIGPSGKLQIYLDDAGGVDLAKYRAKGNLPTWTRTMRFARGNSRAQVALALAFVGPVGAVLGVEQVALQFVGKPTTGKTLLAKLAGSVWGRHKDQDRAGSVGFGETWSHTANSLEQLAPAHNHTLLVLDETRLLPTPRARAMAEMIMRLERGITRGRLNEGIGRSWWVPVLSTSNDSLAAIAANDRVPLDDAYRGRLIDIPTPGDGRCACENLHGHSSLAEAAAYLEQQLALHFGHAGPNFVKRLLQWIRSDEDVCREWLEARRKRFRDAARMVVKEQGYLSRVFEKFATVYAAGCLAIRFRLLSFTMTDLRQSLLACLLDHIALGSPVGASSDTPPSIVKSLIDHVHDQQSCFKDLRHGPVAEHDHRTCPGYITDLDGERHFLFSDQLFQRMAGGKKQALGLKAALCARGDLKRGPEGRYPKKFRVARGKQRVYLLPIRARFVDGFEVCQ